MKIIEPSTAVKCLFFTMSFERVSCVECEVLIQRGFSLILRLHVAIAYVLKDQYWKFKLLRIEETKIVLSKSI